MLIGFLTVFIERVGAVCSVERLDDNSDVQNRYDLVELCVRKKLEGIK